MLKLSLKQKILYALAGLIFLFGAAMIFTAFNYSKNVLIGHKKVDFGLNVLEQAEETSQVFIGAEELIRTMAEQDAFIRYMEDNKRQFQREDIVSLMKRYDVGGHYSSIYLMDVYGIVYATTDDIFLGKDLGFRRYFKEAVRDQISVGLYTGYYSQKIGFYFALPVKNDDGIVGVLAFKLAPEKVGGTIKLSDARAGKNDIMLVDKDGIVVMSNNKDYEYKSLGNLSEEEKAEIISDHRLDGVVSGIESLHYDRIQQVVGSMSGTQVFEYNDQNSGARRVAGAAQVPGFPFYVVIDESTGSFSGSALKIALSIAAIILAGSIFMLAAIYWLVGKFLKPIPELINYTEAIARGKFEERIDVVTGDELDGLIGNLNEMAMKLDAYYKLLQSQIQIKAGDVQRKINEIGLKNNEIAETRSKLHNLLKERAKPK